MEKKTERDHPKLGLVEVDSKIEKLKDVVVPQKFFNKMRLGVQILDEIFGGIDMPGILEGSSFLFTGSPGAGKSTMCLQLADLLASHAGKKVLYNIGEENKHMIKLRSARIGVTGDFEISHFEDVNNLIRYIKENGVQVLIQDSLQSLGDGSLRGANLLKSVVKKVHRLTKDESIGFTAFLIGHSTKGGSFSGPQEIKHDLDAHIHIRINSDTGNRIFEMTKNRLGPANMPYEFFMGLTGLDFKPATEEVPVKAPTSKVVDRREHVKDFIKEKLITGEKVSGYCFERFGINCSGGFWRGMLTKACEELKADGHVISTCRIDGRQHSYVED